jgi:hypothetical protein
MSTTVDLPAVGKVKRQWAYAGGALLVGIVGYAWLSRRSTGGTGEIVSDPSNTTLPDGTFPTVTTTTVPDNTDVIATNAQWTQRAIEILAATGGWDASFVATTLGKFLARRGLTPAEENVALAAVAALGQPPTGAPYMVIATPVAKPAPTPAAVPAPTRLDVHKVSATVWRLAWPPVSGATSYQVRAVTGHTGDAVRTVSGTTYTAHASQSGGHLAFEVRARKGSAVSPWTRTTVIGK